MGVTDAYEALVAAGKLTADPAQEALLPSFARIEAALEAPAPRGFFARAPEPPKGLYLWGGVGRGKSMLMDLFISELAVPHRRVHFHAFMGEVQAGLHAARGEKHQDATAPVAAAIAKDIRCLALDEMQITDIVDAMVVGRVFEKLLDAGVVVVTTSNRPPSDLYKDGLNRHLFLPFIALMEERLEVRDLTSDTDYRQDRLQGEARYFTPLGPRAKEALDGIWHKLTDGKTETLTLTVLGRQVVFPQFHNGVARAKFFDLCGKPLGADDYLALADAVRVLMIDDIPALGRSNFNEAKRFVTLIDALYEARVKLICSAADRPDMLYVEGEGTFEFARTASRLSEMQAADWGS